MKHNKSFSKELSLHILLVFSALFAVTILFASISSHVLISSEAKQSARNLLESTINEIECVLSKVEAEVQSTSWLVSEKRNDYNYMYHITRKLVEENEIGGSVVAFDKYFVPGEYYFAPYSYVDKDGSIKSKQDGNPQYDYFSMDWYQIPYLLGKPCWSEPYFDEGGGSFMMTTYSYPLKDEDGRVYAILTADIALNWISDILADIQPYPNSKVFIISRGGAFIPSEKDSAFKGETIFSYAYWSGNPKIIEMAEDIAAGRSGVSQYIRDGQLYFSVYGTLSNGWSLCISCGYKEVLSRASLMILIMVIIGLLGLAAAFFFTYRSIKTITRPLSLFCESAMSIAGGNFNTALPDIPSENEIKQLRDSFDFMQHSLTDYTNRLKESVAANERYESELNIASKIQLAMLPVDFPESSRVSLHAFIKSAREVGGDLYDFRIKDDSLYFAVGDVSGKGIAASIFMAITKAAFHYFSGVNLTLDQIMRRLNKFTCEGNDKGMFVTFFMGKLNLNDGTFEFCNAGHNPPVIIDNSLKAEYMKVLPNIALGVFPDFEYKMQSCTLSKGERLVLYTDGVTEAEREDQSQYGEPKLLEWAEESCRQSYSASEACNSLYESICEFTRGNNQNDDITIMTIQYKNKQ